MSRILIFEKNGYIRKALIQIIQSRFPDVAIKGILGFDDYASEIYNFMPDILILGINDYDDKKMEMLEQIRAKHPVIEIILFIDYDIEEYRHDAILRGANHVISRELWAGNEILALIYRILEPKEGERMRGKESADPEKSAKRPLERRRGDFWGKVIEQEYLAHKSDRRN